MNVDFEATVAPNATVTAFSVTVPAEEQWRLSLLTVRKTVLSGTPGTILAQLFVQAEAESRLVFTSSGDQPFIRQPLYTVLETGDTVHLELTARHYDTAANVEGYLSFERRSITEGALLGVHTPATDSLLTEIRDAVAARPQTFVFGEPASVWVIDHGLGRVPAVVLLDSTGAVVEADISHPSLNQAVAMFSYPVSGRAALA